MKPKVNRKTFLKKDNPPASTEEKVKHKKRSPSSSPKLDTDKKKSRIPKRTCRPVEKPIREDEITDISDDECEQIMDTQEVSSDNPVKPHTSENTPSNTNISRKANSMPSSSGENKSPDKCIPDKSVKNANLISLDSDTEDTGIDDTCGVNDSLYYSLKNFAENYNASFDPCAKTSSSLDQTAYVRNPSNSPKKLSMGSIPDLHQANVNSQDQHNINPLIPCDLDSHIAANIAKLKSFQDPGSRLQRNANTTGGVNAANLAEENNAMLKTAMSSLESVMTTLYSIDTVVKRNASSIDCLNLRLSQVEAFTDSSVTKMERAVESIEMGFRELNEDLDGRMDSVYEHAERMNLGLEDKIDNEISSLAKSVNEKIKILENDHLPGMVASQMATTLKSKEFISDIHKAIDDKFNSVINTCKKALDDHSIKIARELDSKSESHLARLNDKLREVRPLDEAIPRNDVGGALSNKTTNTQDISGLRKDLDKLKLDLNKYSRKTEVLDNKSRRNNLIIDQLSEIDNEDTIMRINTILSNTLSKDELNEIKVLRAYRMGRKRPGNACRKILVEISTPLGRDICIQQATKITKSGNDGRPYYVNEDVPEDLKRKKMDLYRYINHLKSRNHTVEKMGEDLMIDGILWKSTEFNNLPSGDRIMDSRTITSGGIVAFQSEYSPLSNFFPCHLKMNGMVYCSAEQCYQHMKAVHHKKNQKVRDILATQNPYDLMYYGKEITEDIEWAGNKLAIMERIIKTKADQVPMFYDFLKATNDLKLIENSWSSFWGSGCAFNAKCLWNNSYRGLNHLGRILQKVRGEI